MNAQEFTPAASRFAPTGFYDRGISLLTCEAVWRRELIQVFEPANGETRLDVGCGTGRLMVKLAQAGFEVSGLDLNPHAVKFCNERLRRHGLPETAFIGDMADFKLKRKVDACFNMINTFRHLPTEKAAEGQFQSIAYCLS